MSEMSHKSSDPEDNISDNDIQGGKKGTKTLSKHRLQWSVMPNSC